MNKEFYDPPEDKVDSCCMSHDICYADCRKKFPCDSAARSSCMKQCNKVLKNCASNAGSFAIPFAMNFPPAKEPDHCSCPARK